MLNTTWVVSLECEYQAVFWTAAFDWLDHLLA
jgi:hypothetical protein